MTKRRVESPKLITGPWLLADLHTGKLGKPRNGLKVFSFFHCGGGSSMGYNLAGFDVLGGVEIDPKMMALYRENIRPDPRFSFLCPIQDFKVMHDDKLPPELFDLDILDGSPPCSSFSMAGSREDAWGEKKKFREGQAEQVLDDLFFHFIDVAAKLRPKVVVAENVKGLILGNARGYVKQIFKAFHDAGYETQLFLLNASRMGVPQARERTFFIARRRDLKIPEVCLDFQEKVIVPGDVFSGCVSDGEILTKNAHTLWMKTPPGYGFGYVGKYNAHKKLSSKKVAFTQTSSLRHMHWNKPRYLSDNEVIILQTFPSDYEFNGIDPQYVCGMSVPPFMMQRVSTEIYKQLFLKRKLSQLTSDLDYVKV